MCVKSCRPIVKTATNQNGDSLHQQKYFRLRDLHWLRVPERIQFRLAVLAFCCCNHKVPSYLADEIHWTDEAESWHRLRPVPVGLSNLCRDDAETVFTPETPRRTPRHFERRRDGRRDKGFRDTISMPN